MHMSAVILGVVTQGSGGRENADPVGKQREINDYGG
jgi:hypothetical protein